MKTRKRRRAEGASSPVEATPVPTKKKAVKKDSRRPPPPAKCPEPVVVEEEEASDSPSDREEEHNYSKDPKGILITTLKGKSGTGLT